ncbi:MAG: hypothetical protein Q9209_007231 [Squamulea sp. 1 TL-2023]
MAQDTRSNSEGRVVAASVSRPRRDQSAGNSDVGPDGDRARRDLIVYSDEEYEERAVEMATDLVYPGNSGKGWGRLMELRKLLYESRWTSALFDTTRWVRDLEEAYELAWKRWVAGEGGDIWL